VTNWWLGATDSDHEGNFVWKQSRKPLTFTHWSEGEPNNYRHDEDGEDCVQVRLPLYQSVAQPLTTPFQVIGGTGRWNDLPCHDAMSYICQFP
jgi:hypothetical protein